HPVVRGCRQGKGGEPPSPAPALGRRCRRRGPIHAQPILLSAAAQTVAGPLPQRPNGRSPLPQRAPLLAPPSPPKLARLFASRGAVRQQCSSRAPKPTSPLRISRSRS